MGLETAEIEGIAHGLYRAAKADEDEPPGAVAIARRLLGLDCIRAAWVDGLTDGARLVYEYGRPRIYVRRRITPARLNFAVGHELGEWALDREGYDGDDRELVADAVAAAILLPPQAFRRAYRREGFALASIAGQFIAPEGAVALRVGEVCHEPVALVSSGAVLRRDLHNELPSNDDIARLSRQSLDAWHPLRFERCGDAERMTAVRLVLKGIS
jgi:hypothetical protein